MQSPIPSLATYSLLGRSGLRVSPICLGTMTFGTDWGWGAPKETAHALLERYFAAGGNFVDTADRYTNGTSETVLGEWLRDRGLRDRAVVATKFSFCGSPGDPNAGGNGRKHALAALEGSLRRLGTDHVDLWWLHAWDGLTPVEEVLRTFDDVVRAGKVRYIGLSDVPAWYAARAQTLAELRGYERVCALQLEYSLVERSIEREHVSMAQELGMGICPWSPLASGMLTGKYRRDGTRPRGDGRLAVVQGIGNAAFDKLFTERNWGIVDALLAVAKETELSPAQIAIQWVARQPGVTSTLVSATRPDQLDANLRALAAPLPDGLLARLDAASAIEPGHPYVFFTPPMQALLTGNTDVRAEPPGFRRR